MATAVAKQSKMATPQPKTPSRWFRGMAENLMTTIILVLGVAVWEGLVRGFHVREVLFPAPSAMVEEFLSSPGWYLANAWYTFLVTIVSFAMAAVIGVALAVLIIKSKLLEKTIYVVIIGLNSVPKVAVAPLFVIWLGTGFEPKVAIGFLIAVFAVVIDTVHGFKSVPQDVLDLAKVLRGKKSDVLWRVQFPYALPSILSGMKVAISLSLVGAIVGEFVSAQRGLGYVILSAQGTFDTTKVFVAIALLAVMGVLLFGAVNLAERYLIPWHASQRIKK